MNEMIKSKYSNNVISCKIHNNEVCIIEYTDPIMEPDEYETYTDVHSIEVFRELDYERIQKVKQYFTELGYDAVIETCTKDGDINIEAVSICGMTSLYAEGLYKELKFKSYEGAEKWASGMAEQNRGSFEDFLYKKIFLNVPKNEFEDEDEFLNNISHYENIKEYMNIYRLFDFDGWYNEFDIYHLGMERAVYDVYCKTYHTGIRNLLIDSYVKNLFKFIGECISEINDGIDYATHNQIDYNKEYISKILNLISKFKEHMGA